MKRIILAACLIVLGVQTTLAQARHSHAEEDSLAVLASIDTNLHNRTAIDGWTHYEHKNGFNIELPPIFKTQYRDGDGFWWFVTRQSIRDIDIEHSVDTFAHNIFLTVKCLGCNKPYAEERDDHSLEMALISDIVGDSVLKDSSLFPRKNGNQKPDPWDDSKREQALASLISKVDTTTKHAMVFSRSDSEILENLFWQQVSDTDTMFTYQKAIHDKNRVFQLRMMYFQKDKPVMDSSLHRIADSFRLTQ